MTRSSVVAAITVCLAIGMGTAWAQNPPAAGGAPAASKMGKARKKFRSECKHNGGKAE